MTRAGEKKRHLPGALRPGPWIEGHTIQRDEEHKVYVIDQHVIACTPTEYRILTLLLEQADRCVPFAQLWAHGQDGPLTDAVQRKQIRTRIIHVISDVRAKMWASGLDIVAVMNYGYLLLSRPHAQGPLARDQGAPSAERGKEAEPEAGEDPGHGEASSSLFVERGHGRGSDADGGHGL